MRILSLCLFGAMVLHSAAPSGGPDDSGAWTSAFVVDPAEWSSKGRNPWFILEPGYRLEFEDGDARLVITVLDETRTVDGVETRVVEERETEGGTPVEVSRNYFAISTRTSSVYYFGEEVDIYKDGKIAGHEGAWLSGVNGAKFGLAMPGDALLGARYCQEVAPHVAMDRAEVVSVTERVKTADGEFADCLKVRETSPLEPKATEYKCYARGAGLVLDDQMRLVRHGMVRDGK